MNITELMKDIKLSVGLHRTPEDGICAMEFVAWLEGLPHSDKPECACPVIGAYVRALNDSLPEEERQELIPYLPRLVGTVSPEHEQERAEYLLQQAYITWVPDDIRQLFNDGYYHRVAAHVGYAIISKKKAFAVLDGVLKIGPQSPGFSNPVEERISQFKELVSC